MDLPRPLWLLPPLLVAIGSASAGQVASPTNTISTTIELGRLPPGKVWLVPDETGDRLPMPHITAAVSAAGFQDTILLSDGCFRGAGNRNVSIPPRRLTIRSENGPERCVIDCGRRGRAFHFEDFVRNDTRLIGVTIVRGDADAAQPNPGFGGALLAPNGQPTIEDCVFRECFANGAGGAIRLGRVGSATRTTPIRDCLFQDNSSGVLGGAISSYSAQSLIERCTFLGNETAQRGGALDIEARSGVVRDSLFLDNRVFLGSPNASGGAAIALRGGDLDVQGCTVVNNQVVLGRGGGIMSFDMDLFIERSIFWGNTSTNGGSQIYILPTSFILSRPTIRRTCVQGGFSGIESSVPEAFPEIQLLFDQDPEFVDPHEDDYRLETSSPYIDAGGRDFEAEPNQGDLQRNPRVDGIVDLGAYESWPAPVLGIVLPGRPGETNTLRALDMAEESLVTFFVGDGLGATPLAFTGCPELELGIVDSEILGWAPLDSQGSATLEVLVPPSASLMTFHHQAVGFRPVAPVGCSVTNIVSLTYP